MALQPPLKQPTMMDSMENYSHLEPNHSSFSPLPHHTSPLEILEILERILYLVPPAQLDSVRLVSHHFNQASFRPRWKYPNLAHRGMTKFGPRFLKYGHVVLELDFTESYMYSPNALQDVDFLIAHCPNVRALALPFGCLTFMGVERLIAHYTAQRQLHTLKLDMTKHSEEPHMNVITQITTLRCLSIRFNPRSQRMMDFDYEDLFEACPLLQDLTLAPAPGFQPPLWSPEANNSNSIGGTGSAVPPPTTTPNFGAVLAQLQGQWTPPPTIPHRTTEECLKYFDEHRPKLRRLHLDRVWFRDVDLKNLALACPNLEDLRVSNARPDFSRRSVAHLETFSLKTVLEAWPRMRKLQVDGNKFSVGALESKGEEEEEVQYNLTMGQEASLSLTQQQPLSQATADKIPSARLPSRCMISSLCLFWTQSIDNNDLVAIVDYVGPTLHRLNIDGCQKLTDHSVRHVLMTCSGLLELSAAELNLTMALFEDKDLVDVSLHKILADLTDQTASMSLDTTSIPEQQQQQQQQCINIDSQLSTVKRKWACAHTLRTLDLSWHEHDGRPNFIPSHYGRDEFLKQREINYVMNSIMNTHHHGPWCCGINHPEISDDDDFWANIHHAGTSPGGVCYPMFRKRWTRTTIYERLKHLERIEVLLLQGWKIPWHSDDLLKCFFAGKMDQVDDGPVKIEMEELDLTPDRVVVQFSEMSQVYTVASPPSNVPSKLRAPVLRGLGSLRHLDIRCKAPFFYSHEKIAGERKRNHPPSNDTTKTRLPLKSAIASSLSSSPPATSPPPPPPPPPPSRSISSPIPPPPLPVHAFPSVGRMMPMYLSTRPPQDPTNDERAQSDGRMFSLLGTLLQICPRLEVVGVAPVIPGDVLGWNTMHSFEISLARREKAREVPEKEDVEEVAEEDVEEDAEKNVERNNSSGEEEKKKVGQTSTPHANVHIVPGRRSVHCTLRPFPELAVIRQW